MSASDSKKASGRDLAVSDGAVAGDGGGAGERGEDIIDMSEAIALLKTTRPTFYRWLRAGRFKGMKVGRQWRFYRSDIERFLRGEEPRIDLAADVMPLLDALRAKARELDSVDICDDSKSGAEGITEAVDLMVLIGYTMRCSDLHIAPHAKHGLEQSVGVFRCRIDGVLKVICEFDLRLLKAVVERWKGMAGCNVNEQRPQDGRAVLRVRGRQLDLRICFVPAVQGECVTARLLDAASVRLDFDAIDYRPRDKELLARQLASPAGMILVAGPTGSGKTTVLYSCLNRLAGPERNVMSVEDPVEFLLPWVVQVSVRPDVGLTFPAAMRSVLRSAPDVVLVGEIRNREMLELAVQMALTGHLILTSLHTDEAAGALIRMVDMGVDPFMVGDATKVILSQRLVRVLCHECKRPGKPPAELLERAVVTARKGGVDWDGLDKQFQEPVGCAKCNRTGYRGRTVIAEVLEVTPEIVSALRDGAAVSELRAIAVGQGMTTLGADGVSRAAAGITSLTEVTRVRGLCSGD